MRHAASLHSERAEASAERPHALISDYAIDWRNPAESVVAALESAQSREAELAAQANELRAQAESLRNTLDALSAVICSERESEESLETAPWDDETAEPRSEAQQQYDAVCAEHNSVWDAVYNVENDLYRIQRDLEWLIEIRIATLGS